MVDPMPNDEEKMNRLRRAMYSRSLAPKLKEHQRRALEDDRTDVSEDWKRQYQELQGATVAPRIFLRLRSVVRWLVIALVIFLIGVAGFLTYYFTIGGGATTATSGKIGISISGPSRVSGGELTELQITISNRGETGLELADLVVMYPPGTRMSPSIPTDVPGQRIPIGAIKSAGVVNVPIRAVFSGAEGGQAVLKARLEYRVTGSSAVFVSESENYFIIFSSSPISVSIEGNTETVSGQPIALIVNVTSNATAPIKDVMLSVGYPFGFAFSSASPKQIRPGVWELGDIMPGASARTITLNGTLSGEPGDERVFRVALGTRKSKDSQGIDTIFSETPFRMAVSKPFLGLSISVNGSNGGSAVVTPGGNVNAVVTWKNNLTTEIRDAVVVARLSGLAIDGSTVRSNDGFYRSSDNSVLWDKTTTSGTFAIVSAGASGSVNFNFQIPPSDILQTIKNPSLNITVHAAGKRLSESGVSESLQSTVSQKIKVASDLGIAAEGYYHDNPFGASGTLPPQSGKETTYALRLVVTNTTNKIKNAKLTAVMPSYVRSLGPSMFAPFSEKISFNIGDGSVTWNIGDIEPGVGVNGTPPRQAAFAIGFTPSTSQIGTQPVLLQDISLTGTDVATGESVSRSAPDVTTNLVNDSGFSATEAVVVR
ncbi:hypothetical protein A3C86_01785 [Candidatus Kaiserbacteria bacterium RIFCSPHIGHO2_02_FULL_49_16]|uniref:DUF11 domain-containing protein n=1 Tax=Candidatus Kaiserbacteria bacterium RIFCSPHIGHO2_02_FULL_49_16 TaxID=1798490 RepID=A0A1F6DI97_9BACT|nr:MAG: hypothetical protein A3C86_01785 [Candidatus Kaiserbacteria bacterium RIFCSPHIGHO2_02_FULL_49_16]